MVYQLNYKISAHTYTYYKFLSRANSFSRALCGVITVVVVHFKRGVLITNALWKVPTLRVAETTRAFRFRFWRKAMDVVAVTRERCDQFRDACRDEAVSTTGSTTRESGGG